MRTDYLLNILKKIAVIEETNYPVTYKFIVENGTITIPFISNGETLKAYVTANDFLLEDCTFAMSNITLFNKTLLRFSSDVNIKIDNDYLIVTDGKLTAQVMLNEERVVYGLNDLEDCFDMDNDEFTGNIIFGKDFVDNFLALAKNESYNPKDTFTIKWFPKKELYQFKLGKNIKLKFDKDGTNTNDKTVVILRVGLMYDILNANKDLVEGYMRIFCDETDVAVQLEFLSKEGIKSVYNLNPEDSEH